MQKYDNLSVDEIEKKVLKIYDKIKKKQDFDVKTTKELLNVYEECVNKYQKKVQLEIRTCDEKLAKLRTKMRETKKYYKAREKENTDLELKRVIIAHINDNLKLNK